MSYLCLTIRVNKNKIASRFEEALRLRKETLLPKTECFVNHSYYIEFEGAASRTEENTMLYQPIQRLTNKGY